MSYNIVNLKCGDFAMLLVNNSNSESRYTWTNLSYQGRYQFSVVASTSKGPGEAATLIVDTQSSKLLIV